MQPLRPSNLNSIRLTIVTTPNIRIKECPEPASVDEEIGGGGDGLEEGHAALCVGGRTWGESRVASDEVGRPGSGGKGGGTGALPVGSFGLLHADVYVGGRGEIVLVEGIVFEGSADEPGCFGGFD